ncbi:MAG: serine hydrolase domain-containing protein [Amphiplicatus sp.]
MKNILSLTFIACLSLGAQALRAEQPDAFAAQWAVVAERYKDTAERQNIAGSSLYFIYEGEVIAAEHYGLADIASGRAVDADTIYHWASVTKTFTAVAAMQLVERGLISLDDPVSKYLPEIRKVHNPYGSMNEITLRHLITHSSGFRNSTFPWGGGEDWHPFEPTDWSQVAAMMPYSEIAFKPGSKYSYSNPGLSMLGRVVEEVTGDDIEIYITKNIFMPLGMTRSYFDVTPYHLLAHRSNNYLIEDGERVAQGLDFDTGATKGNGGLNAPVTDMVKWLNFWLCAHDNGTYETVLPRKTLQRMWRSVLPANDDPPMDQHMGMGFFQIDHAPAGGGKARRYVGHTGDQKAFTVFVYADPATNAAAIFASNTLDENIPPADALLRKTRKELFETIFPLLAE